MDTLGTCASPEAEKVAFGAQQSGLSSSSAIYQLCDLDLFEPQFLHLGNGIVILVPRAAMSSVTIFSLEEVISWCRDAGGRPGNVQGQVPGQGPVALLLPEGPKRC